MLSIQFFDCVMQVFFFSLGVRNLKEARESVETHIEPELRKNRVFYETCDTSDMEAMRKFARVIAEKYPAINLLVNNGKPFPYPVKCCPDKLDKSPLNSSRYSLSTLQRHEGGLHFSDGN
jgi:NAD(P)-dependent dehydrogenase (short-subunit alcohol dehydrogenase family)